MKKHISEYIRIQVALLFGAIALGVAVIGLFFQFVSVVEHLDETSDALFRDPPEAARIQKMTDESTWLTYTNDTYNFSLKYPPSWRVEEATPSAAPSKVYTEGEKDDWTQYREYQSIVSFRDTGGMSRVFANVFRVEIYTDYSQDTKLRLLIDEKNYQPADVLSESGLVRADADNVYLHVDPHNPLVFYWQYGYGFSVFRGYSKSGDAIRELFLKMAKSVRFME